MRSAARIAFVVIALAASGAASAAGVGLRAGTLGVGGDVAWGIAPTLSLRLGYSALNFDSHYDTSNVRYDGSVKLSNFSGLIDWSPVGPFRLTAGLVGSGNKLDVTAVPTSSLYDLNGRIYPASQVVDLRGTVEPNNRLAPYFGIGYGNVAGAGINFYFDLGVVFQGSPKASLSATCGSALSAAQCSQLQSDVAAERYNLEQSLDKYKYYPVGQIGITIGF